MSENEIIAQLVKIRERFRQLTQIYQEARVAHRGGGAAAASWEVFGRAAPILNAAVAQLHALPDKPGQACGSADNRRYAEQLLKEIGELLQTALIMDREARQRPFAQPHPAAAAPAAPPVGAARVRALRAYGA